MRIVQHSSSQLEGVPTSNSASAPQAPGDTHTHIQRRADDSSTTHVSMCSTPVQAHSAKPHAAILQDTVQCNCIYLATRVHGKLKANSTVLARKSREKGGRTHLQTFEEDKNSRQNNNAHGHHYDDDGNHGKVWPWIRCVWSDWGGGWRECGT